MRMKKCEDVFSEFDLNDFHKCVIEECYDDVWYGFDLNNPKLIPKGELFGIDYNYYVSDDDVDNLVSNGYFYPAFGNGDGTGEIDCGYYYQHKVNFDNENWKEDFMEAMILAYEAFKSYSENINSRHKGEDKMNYEYSFITDAEKMYDFYTMSREDFLNSYSYLSDKDYDDTLAELHDKCNVVPKPVPSYGDMTVTFYDLSSKQMDLLRLNGWSMYDIDKFDGEHIITRWEHECSDLILELMMKQTMRKEIE